jgi:diacylglycerol kinase family enzyme
LYVDNRAECHGQACRKRPEQAPTWLQVGGDGLFQEVLEGVMAVRGSGDARRAAAAAQLRLGHIPAGSTDAVAYSLNGTRSAPTAALHVALGDRCRSLPWVYI